MYGDLENPQLGFSITDIPLIGPLVSKLKSGVDKQVEQLQVKVAEFKLLPSTLANLSARAQNLLNASGVQGSTANTNAVNGALQSIAKLQRDYANTNAVVDLAIDNAMAIKSGKVSLAATASVASGATAIAEALNNASHARQTIEQVELSALTPAQRQQAAGLGLSHSLLTSGSSVVLLGAVALGGFLLLRRK